MMIAAALVAAAVPGDRAAADGVWYSESQRVEGRRVYDQNCRVCHGADGVGTENWQVRDARGNLPPPPLNGTAHTWHHSPSVLVRTIQEGGGRLGGTMPAFDAVLELTEMVSVVAYLTSLWPGELRAQWLQRFPEAVAIGGKAAEAAE